MPQLNEQQQQVYSFLQMFGAHKHFSMTFLNRIEPMTPRMEKMDNRIRLKECFNNSFHLATELNGKYCVGYAAGIIPVEHAWIRVGDKYYDPTWQKFSQIGDVYVLMAELSLDQVLEYTLLNDNRPPDLYALQRHGYFPKKR